jgi:HEAT repeat protein
MLATLLLVAAVQNPLVLPPRPPARQDTAPPTPEKSFADDVAVVRRSQLRAGNEDAVIADLAARYPDLAARAAALARTADLDLLHGLVRVLERVGSVAEGRQLVAIALLRPLGDVAGATMQTISALLGDEAKASLLRCVTARVAGTRRAAADAVRPRLSAADSAALLGVVERAGADARPVALSLLGATPTPEARAVLVRTLSASDATLSLAACEALIEHGPAQVSDLQSMLARPASDRAFGYAAVALTRLELTHGVVLLQDAAAPLLQAEVDSHDPFMRASAAIALAQFAYRAGDSAGLRYGDRAIVDGLLLVVAPGQFVPSYSLLHPLASEQLRRLTGRTFPTPGEWTSWWTTAKSDFVGLRMAVTLDADKAALASLACKQPGRVIFVRGENAPAPLEVNDDAESYVLPALEMAQLVQRLQDAGFMSSALEQQRRKNEGVPRPRSLDLRLGAVRSTYDAPIRDDAWMDRFAADVGDVAARERWQLYPAAGADFAAFWRSERAWLLAHADRAERDRHLKDLIVGALPGLSGPRRARALEHLNDVPAIDKLLDERDGLAIVAAVRAGGKVDTDAERLLAIALRVESMAVVKAALDAVDALMESGGRAALPRMFAVLGPERVLACLGDPRPHIRVAAMHEVANMKELAAVPALLLGALDPDATVQQTAIYALGVLRASQARQALIDALPTLAPATRRVAFVALGRIGGEGVLPTLVRGTTLDNPDDKRAAILAIGKLDEPGAADYLASLFEIAGLGPLGTLVQAALAEQGALRARAALRKSLAQVRDPRVRDEFVQLLAEFQDPSVVPELIAQLDDVKRGPRAAVHLAAITGVDLARADDRMQEMMEWWGRHKDKSQAEWFLAAVRELGINTSLEAAHLQPRAGVQGVPELTRILTATDRPHLRLLALALLRDTTQRDFGTVSVQAPPEELIALADRYRFYAESLAGSGK